MTFKDVPACLGDWTQEILAKESIQLGHPNLQLSPTGTSTYKYRTSQIFRIADSRRGRGGIILKSL